MRSAIVLAILTAATQADAFPSSGKAYPVVVETRSYSRLPRPVGATPDVDVGHVLVGREAPADIDVYALTEDASATVPVVSISRRVVLRRFARPSAIVTKG